MQALDSYLALAHLLADAAGDAVRPYFRQQVEVKLKGDLSPVTQADAQAEETMRTLIRNRFPEHGILGEEEESFGTERDFVWVLDPIDGTRAFIAGGDQWGTLVALCHLGQPVLGIINQPMTQERWVGVTGQATTLNGKAIHPRALGELKEATISTTSRNHFTPLQAKAFGKLAESCGSVWAEGDCYAYGDLARGKRDLVVDAGLKPYDVMALVPVINGAGGKITSWDGRTPDLNNFTTTLAAAHESLHEAALALLNTP